ncbi:MAG: M56 family metallopeptidase [Planctomycetota bacterium]
MNGADLIASLAGWIGTFAIHSTCALLAALVATFLLRSRWIAWQERLLRFSLWVAVVSATVQCTWGGAMVRLPLPARSNPATATSLQLAEPVALAIPSPAAAPIAAGSWFPDWTPDPTRLVLLAAASAALGGLLMLLQTHLRLRRLLAGREPVTDGRLLEFAARAARAQGLHQSPHVSRCAAIATPIAFGCIHPEICLPERARSLGDEELRAMLAHEIAHLQRRDAVWTCLAAFVQAVFPWQVLLPIVRRRWVQLVELRCDAIAAGHSSPTAVARCLLEVAEWLRPPAVVPTAAFGMAARPSSLRQRVETALHETAAGRVHRGWSGAFGGVAISALTLAAPGFGDAAGADALLASTVSAPAELGETTAFAELRATLAALEAERDELQEELAALGRHDAVATSRPDLEPLIAQASEKLLSVERSCQHLRVLLDRKDSKRPPIAQR